MDNVKIAWAAIRKYHFWVLCGSILIVSLVCWWMATSDLTGAFENGKKGIQGSFNSINGISSPVNDKTINAVKAKKEEVDREVFGAWERVYREQKKYRQFPSSLGKNLAEFRTKFESLGSTGELGKNLLTIYQRNIQAHVPTLLLAGDILRTAGDSERKTPEGKTADKKTGEKKPDAKETGNKNKKTGDAAKKDVKEIRRSLPVSAGDGVGRTGAPAMSGSGSVGGSGSAIGSGSGYGRRSAGVERDPADEIVGTVEWTSGEYLNLLNVVYDGVNWKDTPPSTLKVIVLQEDLWAYEAVLKIVKEANVGATAHDKAAIKRIHWLKVGRDAAQAWYDADGLVFKGTAPVLAAPSTMTDGMQGDQDGLMSGRQGGYGGPRLAPGGSGSAPAATGSGMSTGEGGSESTGAAPGTPMGKPGDPLLVQDRYVDDFGDPVPSSETYPFYTPAYKEFNMLPFCLNVMMDERKLATLLVSFVNSPTPIDVRRVRFMRTGGQLIDLATLNPNATAPGTMGGGPDMSRNTGPGSMMAQMGMGGSGSGSPRGGGSGSGSPMSGQMRMGGMGMGQRSSLNLSLPQGRDDLNQYDMPIEIHGVIYIFNPPPPTMKANAASTEEKAGAGTPEEAPAAAAKPAAKPAAATPDETAPAEATPAADAAMPQAEPASDAAAETTKAAVSDSDVPKTEDTTPDASQPDDAAPEAIPARTPAPATGGE